MTSFLGDAGQNTHSTSPGITNFSPASMNVVSPPEEVRSV
jgi:hypothetical protein